MDSMLGGGFGVNRLSWKPTASLLGSRWGASHENTNAFDQKDAKDAKG
jgi:hypothetical protein